MLDGLPLHIPSDRVKGHLLVTEQTDVKLPGIVAPLATQIEDGQLLAGGTFDLGDESPAVQPDVIDAIVQGLAAVLPSLRGVGVAYQWCCFRPRHPDRRPVIDMVPGLANAWLTSGHFRTGHTQRAGYRGSAVPLDSRRPAAGGGAYLVSYPLRRALAIPRALPARRARPGGRRPAAR